MRCTICRWGLPLLAVVAGLALLLPAAAADKKDDEGFKDLFNGKDLTGWKTFFDPKAKDADPAQTWTVKEGVIICTGKPSGYFYTDKGYKNYVLRYDWQYARPKDLTDESKFLGNSGCLVHIHDPEHPAVGGVWPQCIEVQGMNRDHGKLLFLKAKGSDDKFDKAAKDKATKPVGEWNTTEITCKDDGSITCKINGTEVSSGKSDLTEGMIGFQSEGAEIHFRNIKIKEMK
jgi:Domain of Unknown Function (DUF1080)